MKRFLGFLVVAMLAAPMFIANAAETTTKTDNVVAMTDVVCSDVKMVTAESDPFPCDAGADVVARAEEQAYNRALRKAQDDCIDTTDECFVEVIEKTFERRVLDSGECVIVAKLRYRCCCYH